MKPNQILVVIVAAAWLVACESADQTRDLIFVDGRAVAPLADSAYAFTAQGIPGVIVHNRRTGTQETIGANELSSPVHTQWSDGLWYVSDVVDGKPSIAVFDQQGAEVRRVDLERIASAPHQFAVLPDGKIVVESPDGSLIALDGDTTTTFALAGMGPRTGLVVAAQGGVLHTVAGLTVTLYNGLGNIRWRIEWPWDDSIYAIDLAVDSQGRTHMLAGQALAGSFIVFGFSPTTGEVVRWSREGETSTFNVGRMGEIYPDSTSNWVEGNSDS